MSSFIKGASQLMALNLWSRILTFVLNQLSLRFITRTVLGIIGMEMELLLSTVLFLARECIRMALLRSESTLPLGTKTLTVAQYRSHQRLLNLAYLPILFGLVIITGIASYYSFATDPLDKPWMTHAVGVFLGAAFVELVSEPFYILGVNQMDFGTRIRVEGGGVLAKCFIAIGLLKLAQLRASGGGTDVGVVGEESGVLAFAWSQMGYACVLAVSYIVVFWRRYRHVSVVAGIKGKIYPQGVSLLIPRKVEGEEGEQSAWIDTQLGGLAWTFAKQGIFKHFLTEGDKILSVAFITTAIQGDYSLVEKYGSIIARLLFQPIEEMSRVFFSKTLPTATATTTTNSKLVPKHEALKALTLLTVLLRLYIILSLYFLAFATNYTSLLIDLLASRQFSSGSAPAVFSAYCLYIPLMAINGVTEAFLQSVAPKQVLMRQSGWMAVCWGFFFATGWLGIKVGGLGGVGVVLANCLNMGMRVWFSWRFVGEYFGGMLKQKSEKETGGQEEEDKEDKLIRKLVDAWELLPKSVVIWGSFVAAWAVTYASNETIGWQTLRQKCLHIAVGGIMFVIVSGVT